MTSSLIALADVKPLLNVRAGNNAYDQKITQMIATVSKEIERVTRQTFAKQARTEFHTSRSTATRGYDLSGYSDSGLTCGAKDQIIVLRAAPLDASVPVQLFYDLTRKFDAVSSLVDPSFVFVDPAQQDAVRLVINYPTEYGLYAFKVAYTAGYEVGGDGTLSAALDQFAPDLKQAAILGTLHLWNRMDPGVAGTDAASEDDKSGSKVNSYSLPQEAISYLSGYRRVLTGRG